MVSFNLGLGHNMSRGPESTVRVGKCQALHTYCCGVGDMLHETRTRYRARSTRQEMHGLYLFHDVDDQDTIEELPNV